MSKPPAPPHGHHPAGPYPTHAGASAPGNYYGGYGAGAGYPSYPSYGHPPGAYHHSPQYPSYPHPYYGGYSAPSSASGAWPAYQTPYYGVPGRGMVDPSASAAAAAAYNSQSERLYQPPPPASPASSRGAPSSSAASSSSYSSATPASSGVAPYVPFSPSAPVTTTSSHGTAQGKAKKAATPAAGKAATKAKRQAPGAGSSPPSVAAVAATATVPRTGSTPASSSAVTSVSLSSGSGGGPTQSRTSSSSSSSSRGSSLFSGRAGYAAPSAVRASAHDPYANTRKSSSTVYPSVPSSSPAAGARGGTSSRGSSSRGGSSRGLSPDPPSQPVTLQPVIKDISTNDSSARQARARRFERQDDGPRSSSSASSDLFTSSVPQVPVVGTCTQIEKSFFRLTSAPNPSNVRPLHILRKTFDFLRQRWQEKPDYAYICDQFQSMRQDLIVQRIRNEFTVAVYEAHARIALESEDLEAFNQCQTQLRDLYLEGIPGAREEFLAYRILYFVFANATFDQTLLLAAGASGILGDGDIGPADAGAGDASPSADAPLGLSLALRETSLPITHALAVQKAVLSHDHAGLFRLYQRVPNKGRFLMDSFVRRQRLVALRALCRSHRPNLALGLVSTVLGFEGPAECVAFLTRDLRLDVFRTGTAAALSEADLAGLDTSSSLEGLHLNPREALQPVATAVAGAFARVSVNKQLASS
ncbi:hypothetical protein H696_00283 [Fonticula alba]|uniref:SAC3/GANP/THP3 conserved domain-containing protein n=1 Tax=Fonticula alba TaxID=691883 RepID=A0A058ZEA6_FONAL|nr:hypothetical protein H696_00283 [Fonticula alba]KCV72704.1 hypothetical protein H696_00283 [Fonticula alba]|eukprot:XP_009492405.1 hypothetical protein H696_00283 [Fonticula alba]